MNGGGSATGPNCLLIADDLTGACDAAVHFAVPGALAIVSLSAAGLPDQAELLAVSTESRDVASAEAVRRMDEAAERFGPLRPRVIFKKIDSTLRGNTGTEIVAALRAFRCDTAVVNPAFPTQGRVVEDGILRVAKDNSFQPIAMEEYLRFHGATRCRRVRPGEIAAAVAEGANFVLPDAACDADLARIAGEILAMGRRILWAGSGGLAAALAGRVCKAVGSRVSQPKRPGPVLFCLGSDHPVALEQQARLLQARDVRLLHAGSATAAEVRSAIEPGNHVVLRIPRAEVAAGNLCRLLSDCDPAAILLSGGDTAALVCSALGVNAIEVCRELAPGIPLGTLRGGMAEGCTVVTKSGGFGSPDDLVRIGDYFRE